MKDNTVENEKLGSSHRAFVHELYKMGRELHSSKPPVVARARRQLARFRRSLTDDRFIDDVYEMLLPCGVPETDEEPCLLIAGLFALHPDNETDVGQRWNLCAALVETGQRSDEGTGAPPAAEARVRQLIGATQNNALEHYLRQAVRLVATAPVQRPLNYEQLLCDLMHLDGADETKARSIRRRWARDFRHQVHTSQTSDKKGAT